MKHIFHPIIGDTTYGDGVHNRYFREQLEGNRLLLAAVELIVAHPETGDELTIEAPLGEDFVSVLDGLGVCQ
jgi:tRNA pseudouridine65 synthase